MTKQEFILSLVRSGLWDVHLPHFDMNKSEYQAVMEVAERQHVIDLIATCLRQNGMGLKKQCVIHMMKLDNLLNSEKRNVRELLSEINTALYNSSPGSFLALTRTADRCNSFSGKPSYHQIVLLTAPAHLEKTIDAINKEWWLSLSTDMMKHGMMEFEQEGIKVLLCVNIPFLDKKNNNNIFKDLSASKTTCFFISSCNLYHSFFSQGISWRHITDWMMDMHHHKDTIDWGKMDEMLSKCRYKNAFKAFGIIAINHFGLPKEDFPYDISEKDSKWASKMFKDICNGFGDYTNNCLSGSTYKRYRLYLKYLPIRR